MWAYVVFDTNCFHSTDWTLSSPAWRVLAYRSRQDMCRLVVPEIVVRELVSKYGPALQKIVGNEASANRDLHNFGIDVPHVPRRDVETMTAVYNERFRSNLSEARVEVPPPPTNLDILELADRAIGRRRPFNDQGTGFRDSLIWETVLDLACVAPRTRVALLSSDAAFAADDKTGLLHPQLVADVMLSGGSKDQVVLFKSMADYVRSLGVANDRLTADVSELLEIEHAQIAANIKIAIADEVAEPRRGRGQVFLETVHDPVIIRLDSLSVDEAASGIALASFHVEVDVDLWFESWTTDARGGTTRTLAFDVAAVYDTKARTLDNFTVGPIRVDVDDLFDDDRDGDR
jgi:hypothetical protein